jgi:hypothetical protein
MFGVLLCFVGLMMFYTAVFLAVLEGIKAWYKPSI